MLCSYCHLTEEPPRNNPEVSRRAGLQPQLHHIRGQSCRTNMVKNSQDLGSAITAWTSREQGQLQNPFQLLTTGMSHGSLQRESPACYSPYSDMYHFFIREKKPKRGRHYSAGRGFKVYKGLTPLERPLDVNGIWALKPQIPLKAPAYS